jgi:rSAM/selenodomain-associated transferase 2
LSAPISVILPTLNVAARLPATLESLIEGVADGLVREVIVSDAGSTDATRAIAEETGAVYIDTARGRGPQLIAGADAARGDWLLFLHADTRLAPGWSKAVSVHLERHAATAKPKAAAFTLAFDSDASQAIWLARRANRRARWFGLPYGDQGLLIRTDQYRALGGFAPLPLMEDVDLVRRIGKARLAILPNLAITAADKYDRDGWRVRAWKNAGLLSLYLLGVSPERLARMYR